MTHQIEDGGKQQGPGILLFGRLLKPGIEFLRSHNPFQRASHHHGDRALIDKAIEHSIQPQATPPVKRLTEGKLTA